MTDQEEELRAQLIRMADTGELAEYIDHSSPVENALLEVINRLVNEL